MLAKMFRNNNRKFSSVEFQYVERILLKLLDIGGTEDILSGL